MTFLLSDLIKATPPDEVLQLLLDIAASLDAPTTSWVEGDPTLAQFMTFAQKLSDESALAVEITKGGFGELLPSDAWADRWAWSRFKVARVAAKEAAGSSFTLTSGADAVANTYDVGEIIVAHDTSGKTYRNSAAITIAPSSVLLLQAFVAVEPGSASSAAPGAITTLVSTLVDVAITNVEALLGTDKETTPHLVDRALAKLGALSPNGPKDAYNYVATTPDLSATSTPITRTKTVLDEPTGELAVYLATAAGAPVGGDVVIVQAAFDANAEPWGTTATAYAATEVVQAITYQAWVRGSNLTDAQIKSAIATALAVYLSELAVGGDVIPPDTGLLYVESLEQVIGHAVDGITRVIVSIPAAAVAPGDNGVIVLGAITPTISRL